MAVASAGVGGNVRGRTPVRRAAPPPVYGPPRPSAPALAWMRDQQNAAAVARARQARVQAVRELARARTRAHYHNLRVAAQQRRAAAFRAQTRGVSGAASVGGGGVGGLAHRTFGLLYPSPDDTPAPFRPHPDAGTVGHPRRSRGGAAGAAISATPNVAGSLEPWTSAGAEAFYRDPVGLPIKTARGFGEIAIGTVAALPGLAITTYLGAKEGDPFRAVKQVVSGAASDYQRRYPGDLNTPEGHARFVSRLRREGAAPEVLDLAMVGLPAGGVAGRGLTALARSAPAASRFARVATAARPLLRVSGNVAVPQDVHPNYFKALGQRRQDRRRVAAWERRQLAPAGARGLAPQGPGEVVLRSLRAQNKAQRVDVSWGQSRAHLAHRGEQVLQIDRGAKRALARLSPLQRQAVFHGIQGMVPLDSPAGAVAALQARKAKILQTREERGVRPIPRRLGRTHDEVAAIDRLVAAERARPGSVFNERFRAFQEEEVARQLRLEADDPGVRGSTGEARRRRTQGQALGIEYPPAALKARAAAELKAGELSPEDYRATVERIEAAKPELDREYAARVTAAAEGGTEPVRTARAEMEAAGRELREAGDSGNEARIQAARARSDAARWEHKQAVARAGGLPEPGFVHHSKRPSLFRSDFTTGSGNRAVRGTQRSEFRLFDEGRADVTPQAYVQSLAKSLKRKHNWKLVADLFERSAVPVSERRLRAAGLVKKDGSARNPDSLSIEELRLLMDEENLDPKDWAFYNPGLVRRKHAELLATADRRTDRGESIHEELSPEGVSDMVDAASVKPGGDLAAYQRTGRGWYLVPKAAYDEIHAGTRPSGWLGRSVDKVQGLTSRVLLGSNPSWLQFQVGANALLAGFGTGGRVGHFGQAPRFWAAYKRLNPEALAFIDDLLGQGAFEGHGHRVHLGAAADNAWVDAWRALGETRFAKGAGKANPLDLVFRGDNAQNNYFKRTVLYSKLKREAYGRMGEATRRALGSNDEVARVLALPAAQRLETIARNPQVLERLARDTLDIMGDYTRFTTNERRYIKRGVVFYGFLRYSLRTLFYTLPVKHPLVMAVTAKLGQLHNEEVVELLGGRGKGGNLAPWAYSRVMFEKDGKLKSIDFARMSPVSNPILDTLQKGPRSLLGMASPVFTILSDQLYGMSSFEGRPFRVKGSAEWVKNPDTGTRVRIVANEVLSMIWPYRAASRVLHPETQGDDTLLFDPRPIKYRTADSQQREAARRRHAGSAWDRLVQQVVPGLVPKPDYTRETVKGIQSREGPSKPKAEKGGSGQGWGAFHGSSGSSGGSGSSEGWGAFR